MDQSLIQKIREDPLYKEAFEAFKNGDNKKGTELLYQMQKNSSVMQDVEQHYKDNDDTINENLKQSGFIMVNKNEQIPDGYHRNTFSEKTCITTQPKDLLEWKNIITEIIYDNDSVYEDHYTFEFTTLNMLYNIKKDHEKPFVGKIISSSPLIPTLNKFKKNSLYLIMDRLFIQLESVDYSVTDILEGIKNTKHLKDITLEHKNKEYNNDEIKLLKKMFKESSWERLKFEGYFELCR